MYGFYGPAPDGMPDELRSAKEALIDAQDRRAGVTWSAAETLAVRIEWEALREIDAEGQPALAQEAGRCTDQDWFDLPLPPALTAVMDLVWKAAGCTHQPKDAITLSAADSMMLAMGWQAMLQRCHEGTEALGRQHEARRQHEQEAAGEQAAVRGDAGGMMKANLPDAAEQHRIDTIMRTGKAFIEACGADLELNGAGTEVERPGCLREVGHRLSPEERDTGDPVDAAYDTAYAKRMVDRALGTISYCGFGTWGLV